MDDTRMDDPDALIPNRVRGYRPGPGGKVINSEFVNISSRFAAGGTRSTVVDLLHFGRGLIEGKVLEPDTVELMLTPMVTTGGRTTGYGMGFGINPRNGRFTAGHSGGQAETRTYFMWFPAEKMAMAIACNYEGADRWPYLNRLYREVTGETMLPRIYAGSREHQSIYNALSAMFQYGFSYQSHHGGAMTDDPDALKKAFAFINTNINEKALAADPDTAFSQLGRGIHPSSGQPFIVAGSYIASRLRETLSAEAVESLHGGGPLPFLTAYIDGYRGKMKTPEAYRLDAALEKRIRAWNADWTRVWKGDARDISFGGGADVAATARRLRDAYAGSAIVPDHWGTLEEQVEAAAQSGRIAEALELTKVARELYPEAPGPFFHAGVVTLAMGQRDEGSALIRKAHANNPRAINADYLNEWAYNLKSAGFMELGLGLLHIAVELHPEVANLYDSLGEFWLQKGDRDKAAGLYRKALELDPELESAKTALGQLEVPAGS